MRSTSAPSDRLQQHTSHLSNPRSINTNSNMSNRPDITLYTDATPNGIKISIALEELGIPYKVEHIDISTNRQKEDWFLEHNPNGRIPALTDTFSDGQSIRLFEGGSILVYLAEQYDKDYKISFPKGSRESYEMNNWIYWQHGGRFWHCHARDDTYTDTIDNRAGANAGPVQPLLPLCAGEDPVWH